jgi:predicted nucleotidyltransferase
VRPEQCYAQAVTEKDQIRHCLDGIEEVLFAFLFGSRAGGRPRQDSDWDVAIYVREPLGARQRLGLRLRIMAELEILGRIDVVVLNDAPPLLAHRAIQGQRIFVRDAVVLVRFIVRTQALAEDQRYWSEIHLQAQLRRLQEGRFGRPKRLRTTTQ